jgi:hypothetical protein
MIEAARGFVRKRRRKKRRGGNYSRTEGEKRKQRGNGSRRTWNLRLLPVEGSIKVSDIGKCGTLCETD